MDAANGRRMLGMIRAVAGADAHAASLPLADPEETESNLLGVKS